MLYNADLHYSFSSYSGDMDLIVRQGSGTNRDEKTIASWSALIDGKVNVHYVEGAVEHLDIMREPYIQSMMTQLDKCLVAAEIDDESSL